MSDTRQRTPTAAIRGSDLTNPGFEEWDGPASGVICAFHFSDGLAAAVAEPELGPDRPEGDWSWTHLRLGDVRAVAMIQRIGDLPPEARELFQTAETRVQLDQAKDWSFGVLPDLERDLSGRPLGEGRLVFAMDARRLLTARLHPLRAVDDLRRSVSKGARLASPAAALVEFLQLYVGQVEDLLESLADRLGTVEDYVLGEPQDPRDTELSSLRRQVARHRRELQALRSALVRAQAGRLRRRAEVLDARDEVIAWIEDVDRDAAALQERGRLLHEEIDTQINSATNRSMRALTIISTLLIPPTLIVGAFGMNLPGMPFEHSQLGFAAASALCVAVVVFALWILRRMNLVR